MKTIKLSEYTELEQKFIKAAVKEFNDLMFSDDLHHGIPKASLGGVVASLEKKKVLISYDGYNDTEFQFVDETGEANNEEPPVLV